MAEAFANVPRPLVCLLVLAPTQAYSMADDPLWVAEAGETYIVLIGAYG